LPLQVFDQPMEDKLGKPGTGWDEPVVVSEVEHANEQFTAVTIIDNSLIHREPVLPRSAGATSDPAPQPFRHGDGNIGMNIGERLSRNYDIPAHIQVPSSIARVSFGWDLWVALAWKKLEIDLHTANPLSTIFQFGPPVPMRDTRTWNRDSTYRTNRLAVSDRSSHWVLPSSCGER